MANREDKDIWSLTKWQDWNPIQAWNSLMTIDAWDTQKKSPYTYTTNIESIEIPKKAVAIVLNPSTDLRISEDSTHNSDTQYYTVKAWIAEPIWCADQQFLYIRWDLSWWTLNFRFVMI
jgi:hypothetical protein